MPKKESKSCYASRGQPTKYREEYCEALIEHMKKGLSFESFAPEIGVSRETIYEWANVHEEFSHAKKVAYDLNLLFWEKESLEALWGNPDKGTFNTTLWIFTMKNRHKWTDRVSTEHSGEMGIVPTVVFGGTDDPKEDS